MTKRYADAGVEIIEIAPEYISLASRRCSPIVRFWLLRGDLTLESLIAAIYLQGTYDGFIAAENQHKRQTEKTRI
jgi:hypothetical protein